MSLVESRLATRRFPKTRAVVRPAVTKASSTRAVQCTVQQCSSAAVQQCSSAAVQCSHCGRCSATDVWTWLAWLAWRALLVPCCPNLFTSSEAPGRRPFHTGRSRILPVKLNSMNSRFDPNSMIKLYSILKMLSYLDMQAKMIVFQFKTQAKAALRTNHKDSRRCHLVATSSMLLPCRLVTSQEEPEIFERLVAMFSNGFKQPLRLDTWHTTGH